MTFSIKRIVDDLGRIVIPKPMRTHYGLDVGSKILIIPTEDGILLKKADPQGKR